MSSNGPRRRSYVSSPAQKDPGLVQVERMVVVPELERTRLV